MTRDQLRDFLRLHRDGVVATIFGGQPEAAVVGIGITDACDVVFDALDTTHKVRNLRLDPRIALTVWSGSRTAQVEGVADEPQGAELVALQATYYAAFPDGPSRLAWPGLTYVRIRPRWARFSDFGATPARIVEVDLVAR
jgi:nitroimidazol reductase NimA-like FMN-containing flavoprotein (pyridoxamine 5'-phosphate oxidase superfamily)